jgi:hypothetical protein
LGANNTLGIPIDVSRHPKTSIQTDTVNSLDSKTEIKRDKNRKFA